MKNKRKRIIQRRKKKGIKKLPRKTLFKPMKRPNLAKDPIWREVFLSDSEEEKSEEEKVRERRTAKLDNSDIASIANSEIKHTSEMSKLARIDTTKRNNSAKIIENKKNLR